MTQAHPGTTRDAPAPDGPGGPGGSAQHRSSDPSSARVAVVERGGAATGTAVVERLLSEPPAAPDAGAPGEQGPGGARVPAGRRRRWPWWTVGALALACAGAVAAWLLLGPGLGGPEGRVAVSGSGGSQVVTVTNGSMSVEQLDDLLAAAGQPRALQRTGGAYLLTTDLVVGPGAEVTVARHRAAAALRRRGATSGSRWPTAATWSWTGTPWWPGRAAARSTPTSATGAPTSWPPGRAAGWTSPAAPCPTWAPTRTTRGCPGAPGPRAAWWTAPSTAPSAAPTPTAAAPWRCAARGSPAPPRTASCCARRGAGRAWPPRCSRATGATGWCCAAPTRWWPARCGPATTAATG